jgi:hypothetical protein
MQLNAAAKTHIWLVVSRSLSVHSKNLDLTLMQLEGTIRSVGRDDQKMSSCEMEFKLRGHKPEPVTACSAKEAILATYGRQKSRSWSLSAKQSKA